MSHAKTPPRAHTDLRESDSGMAQAIDALPTLISHVDVRERHLLANEAYLRTWSCRRVDVIGRPLREILTPAAYDETKPMVDVALAGESVRYPLTLSMAAGKRHLLVDHVPHREPGGRVVGLYATAVDITDYHLAALELDRARRAASMASRAKSEFLAYMSHEIRTPMTAVLGYADLLDHELPHEGRARRHLRTIRRNGQHLLALINDVLELSRIEGGRFDAEHERFSPTELLWDVHELFALSAHDKGVELRLDMPSRLPEAVFSDPRRIRQILFNLVSNALKFTGNGSVVVRARVEHLGDEAMLQLEVEDTGVGFPEERAHELFEPFRQLGSCDASRREGSGLGLAICARLARSLGGTITAEPKSERGSRFIVRVPVHVSDPMATVCTGARTRPLERLGAISSSPCGRLAEPPVLGATHGGPKVLVMEDDEDYAQLLSLSLSSRGASVYLASEYEEAIETFEQEGPSVVISDLRLARGPSGVDFAAALRDRGSRVRLIALSGAAERRAEALDAGFDHFLLKPCELSELYELIRA